MAVTASPRGMGGLIEPTHFNLSPKGPKEGYEIPCHGPANWLHIFLKLIIISSLNQTPKFVGNMDKVAGIKLYYN